MKFSRFCACLMASLLLCSCQSNPIHQSPANNLQGAWEIKSITWTDGTNTQTIDPAQPGMFIFNDNHYALMWSPSRTARTPFAKLAQPTDEEVIQGFKSIVFNAGSYTVVGNEMVATARVAKVPGFAGGRLFYRLTAMAEGLSLTLYDEIYPDGTRPAWAGVWQTTFELMPAP